MKIILSIILTLLALSNALIFAIPYLFPYAQPTVVQYVKPVIKQEKQLYDLLGTIQTGDVDIEYLELSFGNLGDNRGQYNYYNITIRNNLGINELKRTLAHEYLHFVWFEVMTESERTRLGDALNAAYAKDPDMQIRMDVYIEKGTFQPTELFSIYCTESTDSYMLAIVQDCNKYIDRSKIVLTR